MSAAMFFFILNDALVKHVSQSLPAGQLIFIRGLIAVVLVLAVARALGAPVRWAQIGHFSVASRALIDAFASLVYLISLFHMPIANATAINLASPLFITLLAVVFYKERVDAPRWAAIAVGFTGVLLIVQPRAEGFNAFALLCLFGALLHAGRDLLTRRIPSSTPSIIITLSSAVAVCLLAGLLSAYQGWRAFDASTVATLALAAALLGGGYYCIIQASRQGEFSVVAPFRYTGLLCALVIGYWVWGDVPNTLAWGGIGLLIGAGLFMLRRERGRPAVKTEVAAR